MITKSVKTALEARASGEPFVVFNGDCRHLLAEAQGLKASLVLTSPPYFVGKSYDSSTELADFKKLHYQVAEFLPSALTKGASICWQVGHHVKNGSCTPLDFIVHEVLSQIEDAKLRNRIIWTFGHGVHARKRFSGRHETILWYTLGDEYYFDLDSTRVPQKYPGKKHYKGPKKGDWSGHPQGKNPGDVWDIPNVKANHVEKTGHPCQFPIALAQRLVRALCPKGELVFDPFSGVGSAGLAAVHEGRNFLGAEIDPAFCEMAEERWQDLKKNTLQIRPLEKPIYQPDPRTSVARDPFSAIREESL